MISSTPEQIQTDDSPAVEAEVPYEPEISNIPEYLEESPNEGKQEAAPTSAKQPGEAPREFLKVGDMEIPLDTEIVFDENFKAPLKHVKEQYTNLRSRYGELGQKEEAARQRAAQLDRDMQVFQLQKREMDEIQTALSSSNKKEAIDKFFMKAGINPATWWPQFFDETAHIYEQRSQMDDGEKRILALQAENELLKQTTVELKKPIEAQQQSQILTENLQEATAKAGLNIIEVNNVWENIQAVSKRMEQGATGDIPPTAINFVKTFKAATPAHQLQLLVGEAVINRATTTATSIINELDEELAKDETVIDDLRSQILNPYRKKGLTKEDYVNYARGRWGSRLNGKSPTSGDGVEKIGEKVIPKTPSNSADRKPLSMWDLKR